jgi:hypothetical protein
MPDGIFGLFLLTTSVNKKRHQVAVNIQSVCRKKAQKKHPPEFIPAGV